MRLELPRIYPITDRYLSGLSHADQAAQLIAGGARLIQLREKELSAADFFRDAQAALSIARAARVKLIINDRVDIALALGADGVHVGQDDFPVPAARKLLGPAALIGFSTHNLEQAAAALTLPIDYVAFGPVFPTATKENPDPTTGLAQLEKVRALVGSMPLVAIGGLTSLTIPKALAAGADSAAVVSQLFTHRGSIAENLRKLATLAVQ